MRVLHILSELRPSGFEVMLKVSACYWQGMDIQAEILATGEKLGQYAPTLENAGYEIYHLPFARSYLRALSFFISLYKYLRDHEYDVVHVHVEGANFWIALTSKLAGVPNVVHTVHSVFAWTGWLGLKRRVQRAILRFVGVKHVSVGDSVQNTEWTYFRNPTVCIPNWYNSDSFIPLDPRSRSKTRLDFGITEDTFVVTSIGNCSSCKNHSVLFDALARVSREINFLYLHVGEEEPGQPERHLAKDLGIAEQVRFLGFVEDVYPILAAADVYVMPSLKEGLSIATAEAMGVGVPVILADVPGLRDLKSMTDKVVWAKPEAQSIAEALLKVASMPKETRREIGLALHNAVHKRFGIEQGVNAYAALYRGHDLEAGLEWA